MEDISKIKTGITSRRSVRLKERDFDLLSLIDIHGILTKKQMYYYGSNVYGLSDETLKTKFKRWRDKDILESKRYGPLKAAYFRVGKMGRQILNGSNKALNDFNVSNNSYEVPLRKKDHFIGIRDLIIKILTETKIAKKTVFSYSPYALEYKKEQSLNSVLIRPDWILRHEQQHYNLELDAGTGGHAKYKEKLKRYIQLAKMNPNESHHVMITVLTNSDPYFTYIDDGYGLKRKARVLSLKKLSIDSKALTLPNLKISVAPITRMHLVARNWINGDYTNSSEKVKADIDSFKNKLHANPSFNYTIEHSLASNEFYSEEVETLAYADKHFLLKSKIDGEEKTMLIKFMQEGDVRSLAEINHLNQQQQDKRFKRKVDFIIALYRSREELECDIVDKFEHVLFTSLDSLTSNKSPFTHYGKVVSI